MRDGRRNKNDHCLVKRKRAKSTETLALFVSHWIVQRISPSKLQADWLKLKASTQQYSFMQPFVI